MRATNESKCSKRCGVIRLKQKKYSIKKTFIHLLIDIC